MTRSHQFEMQDVCCIMIHLTVMGGGRKNLVIFLKCTKHLCCSDEDEDEVKSQNNNLLYLYYA